MPYKSKAELPDSVKNALPAAAQTIFLNAYNSVEDDEEKASKIAWGAVKKAGYKKSDDKWIKEDDEIEELYVGSSISFEQLEAKKQAQERAFKINELTDAYLSMIMNIMDWSEDKIADLNRLSAEFTNRLGSLMEAEQRKAIEDVEGNMVELSENEQSPITTLEESDNGPLHAVVRVIKPGWGNKKHNHYYPKDVLQRDAYRFIGAKMFETDHRPHEKSTKTWVSTVEDIVGFEEGAPLAKVAVHDSNFAERLRNLDKMGLLEKMECSIYASGLAKGGFKLNGREGKQVEGITGVSSVDWVTRAGAGGAAVSLMENDDEELTMDEKLNQELEEIVEEEVVEEEVEEVEIQESEEEPKLLEVKEVKEILAETELPDYAQSRLAFSGRFMTAEEVQEAAQAELQYIKTVTRSGKPFAMSKTGKKTEQVDKFAEAEKAKNKLAGDFMQKK